MLPQFIKNFRSLWAAISGCAVAGPLLTLGPELYPPWPDSSVRVGVLISAGGLILAYARSVFLRHHALPVAMAFREGSATILLGCLSLLIYVFLYSLFVVSEEQIVDGEPRVLRFIIGFSRKTPYAGQEMSDFDLLSEHLFRPEEAWTASSLAVCRLALNAAFGFGFALLSYGSALIAATGDVDRSRSGRTLVVGD